MSAAAAMPTLHGRAEEARALDEMLDLVHSGRPATTLVEGEAGIGKSRLLAETVDHARARGFQVAIGQSEELEQTRPFGVVATALGCARSAADPRRAAIAALLTTHAGADYGPITVTSDPGLQFRVVDAFVDLVEELALYAPMLIGLDDLQWADPSSLLTINAIGRRLTGVPIALVGCLRPLPRLRPLEQTLDSLRATGARELRLGALSSAAVSALVAESVGAEPGPELLREIAGAGGNPLFVRELVGAMQQEGIIENHGGRAAVGRRTLPPSLRLTILRRLSFLPEETLQALRSASILGGSFTLGELSATVSRPVGDLSGDLAEALLAGVLADDGLRLRFRHDLIRDAIYEDLPGSVRLALHREAGHRLAAAGAPARQAAEQLARGAIAGDEQAIRVMITAAREEADRSPDIAADLLERAIALMKTTDRSRDAAQIERAGYLMRAGRIADAEAACVAVLDRPHDAGVDGIGYTCLGLVLLAAGRLRDGLSALERAGIRGVLSDPEWAVTLSWASVIRLWLGDLDGVSATARLARTAEAGQGDPMVSIIATAMDALVCALRGRLADAARLSAAAIEQADRSPGRAGHRYPVSAPRAFILTELDRLSDAAVTLDAGTRTSEDLGIAWHLTSYQMVRAVQRFHAGEWDDAIGEVEANLEVAHETGETYSLVVSGGVLALIWLHRNDLTRAEELSDRAIEQMTKTETRYRAQWAMCARALVLEANGDARAAYETLSQSWRQCARLGLAIESRVLGVDLVRLALSVGEVATARDVCAAVAALADDNDVASLTGAALHCRGLVEDDPQALSAAVDALATSPRVFEAAFAQEAAGAADIRHGQPDQARPLLERAVETYERLDAARDIARAEAALRAVGVRRGRRGKRGRPQWGWPSLTETERNVARLVAVGLSNPQIGERLFVSRKTVQTHVSHVFAKLGISSRAELAAAVIRHDAADSQH